MTEAGVCANNVSARRPRFAWHAFAGHAPRPGGPGYPGVMTPRAARLSRGALLGGVATVLAAVSHLTGGGPAPSAIALALGAVFATAVGTVAVGRVAAGRRIALPRLVAGVAIAQLAFHLAFSLLGQGGAVTATGAHHHALVALVADPGAAVAQGGGAMWLAHLVAGALTVLYLRHLERRVWGVLARLGGFLVRALGIRMPAPAHEAPRAAVVRHVVPRASALLDTIARRGPPRAVRA